MPRNIDFVSKRLGRFTFSPQDNWIITQSWVQSANPVLGVALLVEGERRYP